MIEEFGREESLEEFKDTWLSYRQATRKGITAVADVSLRNLFGELSMLQSHAEMRLALLEAAKDKKKLEVELVRSQLLATVYKTGPMTGRNASVESDEEYVSKLQELQTYDDDVTIAKGIAKACTIAAASLSREISARLKD
jgi:hypothetical protein